MDETLWYKFTQHSDLKAELLATGDAELVEVLFIYFRIFRMLKAVFVGL
jgi:diaminohydroxyphosphoribosylaminopyrimidine deaminase/5-amino-6-(5-phosphoribosylamino)uracil reductase